MKNKKLKISLIQTQGRETPELNSKLLKRNLIKRELIIKKHLSLNRKIDHEMDTIRD